LPLLMRQFICSARHVEAALLDVPMIVVYKVSNLPPCSPASNSDKVLRHVNLIADREVAPELIQENFEPERLPAKFNGF